MNFFDAHTHILKPNHKSIFVCPLDLSPSQLDPTVSFVFGLHPWDQKKISHDEFKILFEKYVTLKNCVGIGEIGIDHYKNSPQEDNINLLEYFIQKSFQYNKPITWHLVRCEPIFMNLVNSYQVFPKSMIHAYSFFDIKTITSLKRFDFYFSLGIRELKKLDKLSGAKKEEILLRLTDRLLLETDDQPYNVEVCYQHAAQTFNLPIEKLEEITSRNFHDLFSTNVKSN